MKNIIFDSVRRERIVTADDLKVAGVESTTKDLHFTPGTALEVNNDIAEALLKGDHFVGFKESDGKESAPKKQATDADLGAASQSGAIMQGGAATGGTTSGTTGSGTTSGSTATS